MSIYAQEFKLKKINDHGKEQKRTLQIRDDRIVAMKGNKVTRDILFSDITGITFNINGRRSEFVIHNHTGDLRYRCKDEEQRKIIMFHINDHCKEKFPIHAPFEFFVVNLEDLKPYHNTKKNYEEDNTIRIPSDCKCNPKKLNDSEYLRSIVSHGSIYKKSRTQNSIQQGDDLHQGSFGDSNESDDESDSEISQKPKLLPAALQEYHSIKTDGEDIFEDSCVETGLERYRRNTKFISSISSRPEV
jgi:hypothetical protein